jgi:hypothetical protein
LSDKSQKVGIGETPNPEDEKDEVKAWLRTVQKTEKDRDDFGNKAGWKRYIEEYKNEWGFLQQKISIPAIPINLIYAYTKTEIARLYFRDPWITVNPKRVEDIGSAQIAEQIINYTWGELALKQEIKKTLLEAILVGHSYMKVGYAAEFGTVESQPPEKKGPGRPKKVQEIETSEYIKSENVFAYHVPYKEIIFDPSATFPPTHNARWMAHKITKPLRAVKESGIYEHTDMLKSSGKLDDEKAGYDTSGINQKKLDQDIKSVTLYEIYDLDHMKVRTVSPGCDYFLNEIDYPEYLGGGFPFSMLAFNPVPGEVFPMSDVAAQEGLSIEMTKIVAIWVNHLKRWNRQIIIEPDLFTAEEEDKFKDSIDGAVIKAQGGDIQKKFYIPQYAPVAADSYQIYNEVYKLHQIVSGQTPADQGGQAKVPTRTLGELRLQMMGGHARADEKVDVLEDFIAEIARKLLGIMQKKYDLPKISRIVGPRSVQQKIQGILPGRPSAQPQLPGGQPNPLAGPGGGAMPPGAPSSAPQQNGNIFTSDFSFSWNRQDILGEMDIDVVAGSTVPMDRESQLQILEKMVPLLPAAGVTPGSPAAKAYAREVFRLIGIQSIEAIMDLVDQSPPQPNPKMAEIQMKTQAKMMETKAKVDAKKQETQVKLQGMQMENQLKAQKAQAEMGHQVEKHKLDIHKNVINTILQGMRAQEAPANEGGNGNGL